MRLKSALRRGVAAAVIAGIVVSSGKMCIRDSPIHFLVSQFPLKSGG